MSKTTTDRALPYVERLFDNEYARQSIRDAASALRDAYSRGTKKGKAAPADRKFRDRLTEATVALRESADALQNDRRRPRGQIAKRGLVVLGLAVAAGAVAFAASDELREMVFGEPEPLPRDPSVS